MRKAREAGEAAQHGDRIPPSQLAPADSQEAKILNALRGGVLEVKLHRPHVHNGVQPARWAFLGVHCHAMSMFVTAEGRATVSQAARALNAWRRSLIVQALNNVNLHAATEAACFGACFFCAKEMKTNFDSIFLTMVDN